MSIEIQKRFTMSRNRYTSKSLFLVICLGLLFWFDITDGRRIKRSVMMGMNDNIQCISGTITERNSSTSIILTGTVIECDKMRPDKYNCRIQVWRFMKGRKIAGELVKIHEEKIMKTTYTKSYVEIFGLGNPAFCDSEVKEDKTKIFFLNRVDDRLVLAASLLHITLKNLENTENVIKGMKIEEEPKKKQDPCLMVLCGFEAKCEASANGTATCVCPKVTCGKSPDSSDIFAPVCGSDGVTYSSECRLKASECWSQRRIRIVSRRPCTECESAGRNSPACKNHPRTGTIERRLETTASQPTTTSPVQETDPCKGVICGNMAKCVVVDGMGKCQCHSCDNAMTKPVCGSDQKSYRSECDLRRAACEHSQSLKVLRRAPCDPCEVYNEKNKSFEPLCEGSCSLDVEGNPQCCDSIECEPSSEEMMVCGSDGRTYMSKCALQKYSCKIGRDISQVSLGSCPSPRETTIVQGSTSIAADEKCPGNCDESSPDFIAFKSSFEENVNKILERKNKANSDAGSVTNFKIEEVRRGSAVLVYSAMMTWSDMPIGEDFVPGLDTLWAFERLHDPAVGALKEAIISMHVTLVLYKKPGDDFMVQEVCGMLQCEHGASCMVTEDNAGGLEHSCDCSAIGNAERLPVTLGCKLANNNRFYDNKVAVRQASCMLRSFFTFRDICRVPPKNPCDDISCDGDGSMCIITNGVASCDCVTCSETFEPVCGSNEQTYRSMCHLNRENCIRGTSVTVASNGMCASQCDEVDCRHGGQCEELLRGSALCICPSSCIEVYSPVCGSDGITYENECRLSIAACNKKMDISVLKMMPCNGTESIKPPTEEVEEGSGEEGSGEDDCHCKFGATCDETIDDEDRSCVCDIKCDRIGSWVCGSDGKTYTDECELLKTQCEMQKLIKIASQGRCADLCSKSVFGCCDDGITPAKGSRKAGCPETCKCNEHGSFSPLCNHTTGQCVCRPGVGGQKCDQCQPGFWNFRAIAEKRSIGCMDCRCEKGGSVRDDCDQMTGQCVCKEGITGVKCSKCENGELVTDEGCVGAHGRETAGSCGELNCRFGQECVARSAESGLYMCQCPPLSSCDTYANGKICASNGITYADECQMVVVACRESIVLTVISDGTCSEYFKSKRPVVPPIVTPASTTAQPATTTTTSTASTTMSTTTASTTSKSTTTSLTTPGISTDMNKVTDSTTTITTTMTSTMAVKTPDPDFDIDGSGDGGENTDGNTTIDDEDDNENESSGDETDDIFPTGHTDAHNLVTPESMRSYQVETKLKFPNNTEPINMDDLLKDPEEYGETITSVFTRLGLVIAGLPGSSPIALTSLTNAAIKQINTEGIVVTFQIDVSDKSDLKELQNFINANLDDGESFMFIDSAVRPVVPPLTNLIYMEDDEWSVPQFGGSSYMEFKKMSAYSAATIHMTFKSVDSEGLLLYNGQNTGRDFISLAIIGGYVEFRFDTGSGPLSLRSNIQVNDGQWHEVVSRRNRREGMLMVDNEPEVAGTSPSTTTGVNLDTSLFIGGTVIELQDSIFKQTGVTKGLTGCISNIKVGEHGKKALSLSSQNTDAINTFRVAECSQSPCLPNPCRHTSKCFITYQLEEFTYKCDCGSRYYGDKCQHRTTTDTCASNPCHESSTCVEDDNSYRCICPESRTGTQCTRLVADLPLPSTMEPSYMPMFAGDSYIQRPSLVGVGTKLDIEIVFYTFQLEGLLFYNAQSDSGKGDFVALNLREGYLEFMYDLGEGPAIIKSTVKVSLNEWHVAKLSRIMKIGDLKLDDGPIVKGVSPHRHSQLNLGRPLYIGSVPESVTVPPRTHITTGLMGAIQKFVVNDVELPRSLAGENSESYHIQAFNGHACYRQPCNNNGVCVPVLGNFTCTCKTGYSGQLCQKVEKPEEIPMLQDSTPHAVFFDGRVKAQYNNFITRSGESEKIMKKVNSLKSNHFELQLKTTAHHGLIFYDGKATKRGDYIALSVSYGRLHLTFDLGSGPANIVSDLMVNDGLWKTVKIVRNEHRASLQIEEGTPKLASAPQLTKWLNTEGMLWLGGCEAEYMPPRHRGLTKSFYMGFEGCIRRFRIDGNLLQLREDVLNRPGLATCQDR
ncbi:agrin-like isoform X3 [Styela clava]